MHKIYMYITLDWYVMRKIWTGNTIQYNNMIYKRWYKNKRLKCFISPESLESAGSLLI